MKKQVCLLILGLAIVFTAHAQYPNAYPADISNGYFNGHVFATYSFPAARGIASAGPFLGSLNGNDFTITYTNTANLGNGGYSDGTNTAAIAIGNGAALAARNWGPLVSPVTSNGSTLPATTSFVDLSWRGGPIPANSSATATFTNTLQVLDQLIVGDIDNGETVTFEFLDASGTPVTISDNIRLVHLSDDAAGASLPATIGTTGITVNPAGLTGNVNNEGWAFVVLKNNVVKSVRVTQTGTIGVSGGNSWSFTFSEGTPDRGDAPSGYGDAGIMSLGGLLRLGALGGDGDASTLYSANADGDNSNGYNDEDGVTSITPITINESQQQLIKTYSVATTVTNLSGANAYAMAWIDWNGNGMFDPGEALSAVIPAGNVDISQAFTWNNAVLNGAGGRQGTFLRIRLSSEPMTAADAAGFINGFGEAEDYYIPFDMPAPFLCDEALYLSNKNALYKYTPGGIETKLFDVSDINALAYATTGLLWAYDQHIDSVVIIGSDGIKISIDIPGLPTGPDYNVGAIDAHGYFYLYNGQTAARFYIIDTDPARPTYGRLVDPSATGGVVPYALDARTTKGTVISPTASGGANRRTISDWCVNPVDGRLYAMTNGNSFHPYYIVSYDPVTGGIQEHGSAITGDNIRNSPSGTSYGAIFLDSFGNLFVFANQQGHLYAINTATSTATQISTNSITSSNIDGANCISSLIILPVRLSSFEAYKKANVVVLTWVTSGEQNHKGFNIERSTDGTNWVTIGYVRAQSKNGTGNGKLNYSFTDEAPVTGKNMYRLQQVDHNGKYEYSSVRIVLQESGNNISIYPNPVQEDIHIKGLKGNESISIYDIAGRLILHTRAGKATETIKLGNLNDGVYYIQVIKSNGAGSLHKLVKRK
ncbi:MAG: T9SS type A sorting domain-containing protein [Chitinophagaceae bacterium]|nr:T9SS type A sorting domain-containing protein [Chitinophagaceae bacterium]